MVQTKEQTPLHLPVLLTEINELLVQSDAKTIFDGTVGLGGHAKEILKTNKNLELYIACDADQQHLNISRENLSEWSSKTYFFHGNFSEIKNALSARKITKPLVVLLDLGLCSNHLDDAKKGFAFKVDSPLQMNFNDKDSHSAAQLLNTLSQSELSEIFHKYGEESLSNKIARKIVEIRTEQPFENSFQLVEIIKSTVYPQHIKKTCTRIFQALRIAVNQEFHHLELALKSISEVFTTGDRLGIISYHSLEDRIVKNFFREKTRPKVAETAFSLHEIIDEAEWKSLTKKPIVPSSQEIAENPRSRSAKLRIIQCK